MPAIGSRNPITYQLRDYSGETSVVRLYANDITAVSLPGLLTELATFEAALDAVILGRRTRNGFAAENVISNENADTKDAQVETQMLIRVRGETTHAPWSFRIPTVDYTKFNYGTGKSGDQVIIEAPGWSAETEALINALQTTFKMPDDRAEGIVVVGMEVVR